MKNERVLKCAILADVRHATAAGKLKMGYAQVAANRRANAPVRKSVPAAANPPPNAPVSRRARNRKSVIRFQIARPQGM